MYEFDFAQYINYLKSMVWYPPSSLCRSIQYSYSLQRNLTLLRIYKLLDLGHAAARSRHCMTVVLVYLITRFKTFQLDVKTSKISSTSRLIRYIVVTAHIVISIGILNFSFAARPRARYK